MAQKKTKEKIQTIGTAQALRQDSDLFLYDIPEQLKGKPKYFLSDDDRVFWWDGTEEVIFSERMEQWLVDLAKRHKQITEELNLKGYDNEDFLREMTEALFSADVYYKRVFAFQNMFYDFLQNSADMRYVAALKLFEEQCEENKESGKLIENLRDTWELTNKNIKCNEGRMNIKRYLGVMANKKLRDKYFGF